MVVASQVAATWWYQPSKSWGTGTDSDSGALVVISSVVQNRSELGPMNSANASSFSPPTHVQRLNSDWI